MKNHKYLDNFLTHWPAGGSSINTPEQGGVGPEFNRGGLQRRSVPSNLSIFYHQLNDSGSFSIARFSMYFERSIRRSNVLLPQDAAWDLGRRPSIFFSSVSKHSTFYRTNAPASPRRPLASAKMNARHHECLLTSFCPHLWHQTSFTDIV